MKIIQKEHGFSIIELVAVIAIIGILAMAVIPKIGKYSKEALNTRYMIDAQNIIQAVELYNIDCENDKDRINETTSISDLKTWLYNETDDTSSYLSKWPEIKYKNDKGEIAEPETFKDILQIVKDKKAITVNKKVDN